jgi:predicted signal transduction protein with EAL and GGDEF domain
VLKEVARRITGSLREVDLAARYGGEEFVVLLPHTSKGDARIVAERLLKNVRKQDFTFAGEIVTVTTSIGCAGNSDVESSNPEDLVKAADVALYSAKRNGRNCIVMYSNAGDERTVGSAQSLPAPAMPFPASMPAPAGPFNVAMPSDAGLPTALSPLPEEPPPERTK